MKALLLLTLIAGAANAQDAGPPQHEPLTCNPLCVRNYCEARCSGPHRERLQGRADCRRNCEAYVTNDGACFPCKEESK